MRKTLALVAALAAGVSIAACDSAKRALSPLNPPIEQAPPQKQLDQPVQHVFVIFLENHTYDSYFAAYPNPGGDPPTKVGLGANGRQIPLFEPSSDTWSPGDNSWTVAHQDWANGAMNGFDQAAHQPGVTSFDVEDAIFAASGPDAAYASYGVTEDAGRRRVPYYWFLADQGVLCDRFFCSLMGPSWPNHLYVLAGSSGGVITNRQLSGDMKVLDPETNATFEIQHISPQQIPDALPVELEKAGLAWTILQEEQVPGLDGAGIPSGLELSEAAEHIDVIHALPDFEQRTIVTADLDKRMPEYLAKGWGGHVTWIKPDDPNSEHPVVGSVADGQKWVRKILDAIGHSSLWEHSVVFITWDDYGGFYDHVPPPQVDGFGYGFRVPCLVVSPYAKKGVVQHETRSFESILRYCEQNFGLPSMNARDAIADDFSGALDLQQAPRPYSDFVPSGG